MLETDLYRVSAFEIKISCFYQLETGPLIHSLIISKKNIGSSEEIFNCFSLYGKKDLIIKPITTKCEHQWNKYSMIPKRSFLLFLFIIISCYIITTFASITNKELYLFLLKEDGPIENFATVSVLMASLLFLIAYFKHANPSKNIVYLCFSLVLLLLFLEEISWGQRIFSIDTPDLLERVNAQKEINIHNFKPIYKHINIVSYAVLQFYLVGIVLLTLIFEKLYQVIVKLKLPVPSPATAFLMCANYFLYHDFFLMLASRFGYHGKVTVNYVEIYEAGIELSLLFFSIECLSRGLSWRETANYNSI